MPDEICTNCGSAIKMAIFKGTGVCCDLCRKKVHGDDKPVQPIRSRTEPPPMMVDNSILEEVEHP